MNITDQFRTQVEDYLKATQMTPTKLGQEALRDPKFVFDLRAGRSCSAKTMDRVLGYISQNAPQKRRKAS
jgi:hypothetical protein